MKNLLVLILLGGSILWTSCKDDPEPPNPEEVITTVTYTLSPVGGGDAVKLQFRDLDGDGGDDPVFTLDTLKSNTQYTGSIEFLNESEMPGEDITEEIEAEAADHQVFFVTGVNGLSITYADTDPDGKPLGLQTTVQTGDVTSGKLTITLRHEPDKSANGVADGNIVEAGGETDIEVEFDIEVAD